MHNDQTLLHIRGRNVGDYARQLLRNLYSREEIISSILPPGGARYSCKCLDPERFEELHKAIQKKYRIADEHYDDFFTQMICPKLVDFVCDERKPDRQGKKQTQN